jgi:hypothetical protein
VITYDHALDVKCCIEREKEEQKRREGGGKESRPEAQFFHKQ